MLTTVKETLKDIFSLKNDIADSETIKNEITSGAKVKGTNMCILILAIMIASIGLNMNQTAVIIGAMLISPLMGGIVAIGYGVAVNNLSLAKKAAVGLAFQVIICIITSTVYFSITPVSDAHSEILARTSPTIWDVLIATAGGIAGIIGITRKEKTNVIPGVAIATALMPPLCTAGYGLAQRNIKFFGGAMYLFIINSFFICLSAFVIIKLLKIPGTLNQPEKAKNKLYAKLAVIAVLTIIPGFFMTGNIIQETVRQKNISDFIEKEISFSNTEVVKSYQDKEKGVIHVSLIGKRISEDEIDRLNDKLADYSLEGMALDIVQSEKEDFITPDEMKEYMNNDKNKIDIALKDQEIKTLRDKLSDTEKELKEYKNREYNIAELKTELQSLYPQIDNFSMGVQERIHPGETDVSKTLLVVLYSDSEISEDDRAKLGNWFRTKTKEENIEFVVEPTITEEPTE